MKKNNFSKIIIIFFFVFNVCCTAMPGINECFVGQNGKFCFEGIYKGIVIPSGQVASADFSVKKTVSAEKMFVNFETKSALSMSGGFYNFNFFVS